MPRVLTCEDADYNAGTGECAAPYYLEQPGVLPALPTVQDSYEIGSAIALLWIIAYCYRALGRVLDAGKPTNQNEE